MDKNDCYIITREEIHQQNTNTQTYIQLIT